MLQTQTIEPGTLDVLKRLMETPELSDFVLVGGTALSLLYGHRLSIDIDLFSTKDFDKEIIVKALGQSFSGFSYTGLQNPIGIFAFINDIKLDLVKHHQHPLIAQPIINSGIRLISIPDIIAMKVNQ